MKTITIEFTVGQARALGLLTCKCGLPENNHFSWGKKCAHNDCKEYREVARVGQIVKRGVS